MQHQTCGFSVNFSETTKTRRQIEKKDIRNHIGARFEAEESWNWFSTFSMEQVMKEMVYS